MATPPTVVDQHLLRPEQIPNDRFSAAYSAKTAGMELIHVAETKGAAITIFKFFFPLYRGT